MKVFNNIIFYLFMNYFYKRIISENQSTYI